MQRSVPTGNRTDSHGQTGIYSGRAGDYGDGPDPRRLHICDGNSPCQSDTIMSNPLHYIRFSLPVLISFSSPGPAFTYKEHQQVIMSFPLSAGKGGRESYRLEMVHLVGRRSVYIRHEFASSGSLH